MIRACRGSTIVVEAADTREIHSSNILIVTVNHEVEAARISVVVVHIVAETEILIGIDLFRKSAVRNKSVFFCFNIDSMADVVVRHHELDIAISGVPQRLNNLDFKLLKI